MIGKACQRLVAAARLREPCASRHGRDHRNRDPEPLDLQKPPQWGSLPLSRVLPLLLGGLPAGQAWHGGNEVAGSSLRISVA